MIDILFRYFLFNAKDLYLQNEQFFSLKAINFILSEVINLQTNSFNVLLQNKLLIGV